MIYIKVNNTLSRIISVGIRSRKCLPKPLLVTEGDYTDTSPNKTSKTDVPCPKKPLQTSKKRNCTKKIICHGFSPAPSAMVKTL